MTESEHALTKRALIAERAVNQLAIKNAQLAAQLHGIEAARIDAELKALGEWRTEEPDVEQTKVVA